MAFRQCFFVFFKKKNFDAHEVTKIVLPQKFYKIWRRRQIVPVGPRNWTKKISRVNTIPDETIGSPLSVFSALGDFFQYFFHKRVPNSPIVWHFEVLLLFLSLRYGADLGRSRLFIFTQRNDGFHSKHSMKLPEFLFSDYHFPRWTIY